MMSSTSRTLTLLASLLVAASTVLPIWRIELDAPQYPEGLSMQIYSYKLGGDVDIINGLNHYIGMQTLHAENFLEFTLLPYLLGGFALLILLTGLIGKRSLLFVTFIAFVLFGLLSIADFWRWEYNYGHNLDPNAAIVVPGMAYQPPLIGFKQLLNFGAFSIPDIGGWLLLAGGLLLSAAAALEKGLLERWMRKKPATGILLAATALCSLISCDTAGPEPINLHADKCEYCQMTISDARFGAEVVTTKGRVYKFDDLSCLLNYEKEKKQVETAGWYVCNFSGGNPLIDATQAWYVVSEDLRSPMGSNTAAFESQEAAAALAAEKNTAVRTWQEILAP